MGRRARNRVMSLTLTINGRTTVYAAVVGERDPMEMTLGEWQHAPVLSACALFDHFLASRPTPEVEAHE